MSNLDEKDFTCVNGCDLSYESDGKKYSRKVWHKLLGSGVDHWDCPDCTDNCGVNWNTSRFMNLDEIVAEIKERVRALRVNADYQSEEDLCDIADKALDSLQDVLGIKTYAEKGTPENMMDYEMEIRDSTILEFRQAISNRLEETK